MTHVGCTGSCSGKYRFQSKQVNVWSHCTGALSVLKDGSVGSEPPRNLIDYVNWFRHRLCVAGCMAREKLGQSHVAPVQAKVMAIANYPAPTNKKELQRFLGLVGSYRSLVRTFQPLNFLLLNSSRLNLNLIGAQSFREPLKKLKLCFAVHLSLLLHVLTETSCSMLATWGQVQYYFRVMTMVWERPVSFFSKKCNTYQRHCKSFEATIATLGSLKTANYPLLW